MSQDIIDYYKREKANLSKLTANAGCIINHQNISKHNRKTLKRIKKHMKKRKQKKKPSLILRLLKTKKSLMRSINR